MRECGIVEYLSGKLRNILSTLRFELWYLMSRMSDSWASSRLYLLKRSLNSSIGRFIKCDFDKQPYEVLEIFLSQIILFIFQVFININIRGVKTSSL
jgi:hypothetical protein